MADVVRLANPRKLQRNPENPRLIFRPDELASLQDSIEKQGILVPLTVFEEKKGLVLLDGERRWRCALKLGLTTVPVIVQPKPDRLRNIMMMFAIHNARKDWDPLPSALKLQDLEQEFARRNKRAPSESELAGLASLDRGEVRRLKKLLALPEHYRKELMVELEKPRSQQEITVDHVLEVTKGVESLRSRRIVDTGEEETLRKALLKKFRRKVIKNTVDPRKLARLARAVERKEVSLNAARRVAHRLASDPAYSIDDAFRETVEHADYEYGTEQLARRLDERLLEQIRRRYQPSENLIARLRQLIATVRKLLGE